MWAADPNHSDKPLPTRPNGELDYQHPDFPIKSRRCNPVPWRKDEYPIPGCTVCLPLQVNTCSCVAKYQIDNA